MQIPRYCLLCHQRSTLSFDLCQECYHDLPWLHSSCLRCGRLLISADKRCGACLNKPPLFKLMLAPFNYQEPIVSLITQLKFYGCLTTARLLGHLMAEFLFNYYQNNPQRLPSYLVPVPLHKQRLKERGYNQALELARPIAKRLNLPIDHSTCQRVQATLPQSQLSAKHRYTNIKHAFTLDLIATHLLTTDSKIPLFIDDVITTGSTITEMSRVFRQAGITTIHVSCCARTN